MTRRWSLVSLIAVLAVALAFVVFQVVRWELSDEEASGGGKPPGPSPSQSGGSGERRGRGFRFVTGSRLVAAARVGNGPRG